MVIVLDGNFQKELVIISIGIIWIFIELGWGYKFVLYSKEIWQSQQGVYGSVFCIKMEVVVVQCCEFVRVCFRDLGMEVWFGFFGKDGFFWYFMEVFE